MTVPRNVTLAPTRALGTPKADVELAARTLLDRFRAGKAPRTR
jgi:ABC-type polar amino acid transport system ATPase subunit